MKLTDGDWLPDWTDDYLGIPYRIHGMDRSGADCYGLARLILGERAGYWLPDYRDQFSCTQARRLAQVEQLMEAQQRVLNGHVVPLEQATVFDLLVMRAGRGERCHVATVISAQRCLDVEPEGKSRVARYNGLTHRNRIDRVVRLIDRGVDPRRHR